MSNNVSWGNGPVQARLHCGALELSPEEVLSLNHTASCCDGDIGLGMVCAATLQATVSGQRDLLGQTLTAELGALSGGSLTWHPLGSFVVTECRRGEDSTVLTACDGAWYALSGQYVPTVQSGATVYEVLEDLLDQCGLEAEQTTLNYGLQIPAAGTLTGYSCREMLGYLAALCGKNAVISREGKVRFVWFTASDGAVSAETTYVGGHIHGGLSRLAGLRCKVPLGDGTQTLAAGDAEKAIELACPFMTQTRLSALWDALGGYEYPVLEVQCYGGAEVLPGDLVTVTDRAGNSVSLSAMEVSLTVDGGCRCTLRSFGRSDEARRNDAAGPVERKVQRVASTAGAALLSANGKNKNFYRASAPTTADGLTPGDLWFDTANGNRVSEWTGSAWTLRPFGALAVTNLDAGSITAGTLNVDRIGANSITANKINVSDLFAQDITASGKITGAKLTTGANFNVNQYGYLTASSGTFTNCAISTCNCNYFYFWVKTAVEPEQQAGEEEAEAEEEVEAEDPEAPEYDPSKYEKRMYMLYAESSGVYIDEGVISNQASSGLTPQEVAEEVVETRQIARFHTDSNGAGQVDVNGLNVFGNAAVNDDLGVNGDVSVGGALNVSGNAAVNDDLGVNGDVSVGGALSLANNTWNPVGDDVYIGDCNVGGCLGIKSANDSTRSGIFFRSQDEQLGRYIYYNTADDYFVLGGTVAIQGNLNVWGGYDKNGRAYIIQQQFSFSASCGAGTSAWANQNGSVAVTGYTPLGVVGYNITGTGSSQIHVYRIQVSGNNVYWHLRNHNSTAFSGTIEINVLYMAS